MSRRAEDPRVEAERRLCIGRALLEKGELASALEHYDAALAAARRILDPEFVDWITACRAAAASGVHLPTPELVEVKRIVLRSRTPAVIFRAAYAAATVHERRQDGSKALLYNRIARRAAALSGDPSLAGAAENQLGNLRVLDCRFEDASRAYQRAFASATRAGSRVGAAICKDNLGYCHLALDHLEDGLRLVHAAFDELEREGATAYTVHPLLDLCFGYLKRGRVSEARLFGESGLERAIACGDSELERILLYLLGEACSSIGDAGSAAAHFDRLAAFYPELPNLRSYLDVFDLRNLLNF